VVVVNSLNLFFVSRSYRSATYSLIASCNWIKRYVLLVIFGEGCFRPNGLATMVSKNL